MSYASVCLSVFMSVYLFVDLFVFLFAFVLPCFAGVFFSFRSDILGRDLLSFRASEKSQPTQTSERNHHVGAISKQLYFILQLL